MGITCKKVERIGWTNWDHAIESRSIEEVGQLCIEVACTEPNTEVIVRVRYSDGDWDIRKWNAVPTEKRGKVFVDSITYSIRIFGRDPITVFLSCNKGGIGNLAYRCISYIWWLVSSEELEELRKASGNWSA